MNKQQLQKKDQVPEAGVEVAAEENANNGREVNFENL